MAGKIRPKRTKQQVTLAQSARKDPSVAEAIVWEMVRNQKLGFKFKREHPIGPYRCDFYCAEAKLALEMDGEQHDPIYDAQRDRYLSTFGVLVHRIPNVEFFQLDPTLPYQDGIEQCIRLCEERTGRSRF